MFSAFVVALFTEMYGFPLTIYLLSGWPAERFPDINWLSHDAGHLPEMLFGWKANPHFGPFHLLSNVLIIGGFWLLAKTWPVLYQAQRTGRLASTGPYARIRHPQYAAFILVMTGFLFQWPTLITLPLFPILVVTYVRLAHREETEALAVFGADYRAYMAKTPGWWPVWRGARTLG
jgi:protein-S-isoprenylcysteine O-methyltransferase Ste14